MTKTLNEKYGDNESQRRFRAALKGAMTTPATPLKSMTPKGVPSQQKKAKKRGAGP